MAVYIKEEKFRHVTVIKTPHLQISKLSSNMLDVIVMYRSQEEMFSSMKDKIQALVNLEKTTLIVGDLNFCCRSSKNEVSKYLEGVQFLQLIKEATHIEGALLDQAHFRRVGLGGPAIIELFPNYYSDHDTVTVLIPST